MSLIPNMKKSIADKRNFEVFVKDKAWTNSGFDGNRISYESISCDRAICQPRVSNSPDSLYLNLILN